MCHSCLLTPGTFDGWYRLNKRFCYKDKTEKRGKKLRCAWGGGGRAEKGGGG